jgi:hypothetical protein
MLILAHEVQVTSVSGERRSLQILVGDATDTRSGSVDMLAISCFPDSYVPTPRTLVASLALRGIDVEDVARDKARDWRQGWQTWISQPLGAGVSVGRLACFEHGLRRDAASVVGNLFRAISEFALEERTGDIGILRLPLLSTGDQGADKSQMLEALLRQAYTHLRGALPVRTVQLVIHDRDPDLHRLLVEAGLGLELVRSEWAKIRLSEEPQYDYFVSYRRADAPYVDQLLDALRSRQSSVRIFRDTDSLRQGFHWKPELVAGVYNSRRAVCVISDAYPDSVECVDEFHAALCCARHREGFLRPLLRLSERAVESLPASFRRVNMIDARSPPRTMEQILTAVLAP